MPQNANESLRHGKATRVSTNAHVAALVAFGLVIFGTLIVLVLNYKYFFVDIVLPTSDFASNDILIMDAKHLSLLHGNYSRLGFYHPGPFFLQWMAAFEAGLYDAFPVFASPEAAHRFAIALLHILAFGLYARFWLLWCPSFWLAISAVIVSAAVPFWAIPESVSGSFVTSIWPPQMYLAGALLTATGLCGVLVRGATWLPLLVFGGGTLIHGHASFIGLLPVMAIVALPILYMHGSIRRSDVRIGKAINAVRSHFLTTCITAVIIFAFALPIALNTLLSWPGEIPRYFEFAGRHTSHSALDVTKYTLSMVPLYGIWVLVFLIPSNAFGGAFAREARMLGVLLISMSYFAAWFYAYAGVDDLEYYYLILWMLPFVGASFAMAFVLLSLQLKTWIRVGFVLVVALFSLHQLKSFASFHYNAQLTQQISAALNVLAQRTPAGQKIALRIDRRDPIVWTEGWTMAAALLAKMNREQGHFLCITSSTWQLQFHERYRCKRGTDRVYEILDVTNAEHANGEKILDVGEAWIVRSEGSEITAH